MKKLSAVREENGYREFFIVKQTIISSPKALSQTSAGKASNDETNAITASLKAGRVLQ